MARRQFHLDPATYLEAVRAEVPAYDELQDETARAAEPALRRSVLDLGIGTGETSRRLLRANPALAIVGIDASDDMVGIASAAIPGADVRVGHLEDPLPDGSYDLVVSALAVHHLPSSGKADLFHRIADALLPGGRFVLTDVVVPDRPEDAVTPIEAGVDQPDRLVDQLGWLAEANLIARLAWSHADLAIVIADRPPG